MELVRARLFGRTTLVALGALCAAALVPPAAEAAAPAATTAVRTETGAAGPAGARDPANGKIAFVRRNDVHTIDADGTGDVTLTRGGKNYAPAWSPDGTKIAYVHENRSGVRNLWMMEADGANRTPVTTAGGVSAGAPSWSPDGLQLAFGGPCVTTEANPCQVDPAVTVLDTISAVAPFGEPTSVIGSDIGHLVVFDRVSWSSSGNHIAFASSSYPSLADKYLLVYRFSDDWVDPVTSIGFSGLDGTLANPAFAPDGAALAYDAYVDAQGVIWHKGVELCAYPVTACGFFRDVLHDTQLAFAPAQDRVVLVRDLRRDRVILADLDGTHREELTRGSQPSWQPVL